MIICIFEDKVEGKDQTGELYKLDTTTVLKVLTRFKLRGFITFELKCTERKTVFRVARKYIMVSVKCGVTFC